MTLSLTAEQAFARYEAAFQNDFLTQKEWHTETDGRQLACALGVLDDTINSPADCPTTVMPLAIEVSELRNRDPEPHRKLQALHLRALAGDRAPREEWRTILRDAYADAYADADAYAVRVERMKRLAFGMVECLRRVPTPEAA